MTLLAQGQTEHWYHTNRQFEVIAFNDLGSLYGIIGAAAKLTNVVKGLPIVTNSVRATEYEGVSWGYPAAEAAWNAAVGVYPSYSQTYENEIFDNVGWVKGTRQAYNTWGGYIWLMQNTINFQSSTTRLFVSANGATSPVVKVLVGTIGDFPPMLTVEDTGPTNKEVYEAFMGDGVSSDVVYRASYTSYYQLIAGHLDYGGLAENKKMDPGAFICLNDDDDNSNSTPDNEESGPVANENDLQKLTMSMAPVWTNGTIILRRDDGKLRVWSDKLKGAGKEVLVGSDEKAWNLADPAARAAFIELSHKLWVEGYELSGSPRDTGLSLIYRDIANVETVLDRIVMTILSVDMTAYRPQTETAGYGNPFQRTAVPAGEKESPGVGIRVNGDDDNNNSTPDRNDTTVNNENDLIEVVLNAAPPVTSGGFTYVLKRSSSNIKVWNSATKGTALLDANNETNLTFSTTPMTVWVENPNGGTADLELQAKTDSGTVVCSDKIHFYPFQAIVVGLSGEVWPGGNPLANGMFDVAQELYQRGFDAHYYDEDVVGNNGAGAAYDEVVRAIQHRQVTRVAVYGHSHGGGSTHDLAERLNANRGTIGTFTISFTAYVDAIENDSDFDTDSEVRLPPSTAYHMNYFQTVDLLLVGGAVPGANENLNVNTTQWGQNLNHGAIDNDPNVINAVRDRAIQQVQP